MSEADWGWVAGIIDGEGTIALNKSKSLSKHPPKRGFLWTPRFDVCNTSKKLIDHLLDVVGCGSAIQLDYSKYGRNTMPIWRISFKRKGEMNKVLTRIKDYLVAKKRHAELLMEFLELTETYPGARKVQQRTALRDKRIETLWWELRLLNARGTHGKENVKEEMSKSGFVPYSREEFDRHVKVAIEEMEEQKYETHLRVSREWKARNREQMRAYWRKWYAERRAKQKAAEPSPAARGPPAPSAPRSRGAPRPSSA